MGRPLCVAVVLLCILQAIAGLKCISSPSNGQLSNAVSGTATTNGDPSHQDNCNPYWQTNFPSTNYLGSVWSVYVQGPNTGQNDPNVCSVWFGSTDASSGGTNYRDYGDVWGWLVFWNRDADNSYRFASKMPNQHYLGVFRAGGYCVSTTQYWGVYSDFMIPAPGSYLGLTGTIPFDVTFMTTSAPPSWLMDVFTVNLATSSACTTIVAWARWSTPSTNPTLTFTLTSTGTVIVSGSTYYICLNPDGGDLNYAMSGTITTQNIGFTNLNGQTFYDQLSVTVSSLSPVPYSYHVGLGLAGACNSFGTIGTINARDTSLTINLPLLPGAYTTCATYQGNTYTSQGGTVTIYKPTSYSIASISPAVAAKGVTAPFVLKGSSLTGASNAAVSTTRVGFTSSFSCSSPIWQAQPTYASSTWTLSTTPLSTGTYYLCYTVNSGVTWALMDSSVTLTVIDSSSTSITSIVPAIVGLNTNPTFTLGVSGPVPVGAQVGLGSTGACTTPYVTQALSTSSRLVNFGSLNGFSASAPTQLYVCYFDGTTWVQQSCSTVVAGTQTVSIVTPSFIPFSGSNPFSFVFSAPAVTSQGTWFRFSTSGCTSTGVVDKQYTGGAISGFVFPSAGVYTVCYSVNGGTTYTAQSVTVNVFSTAANSLSFVAGTVGVIGRSGQSVNVTGGPPVTSNAYVFVDQVACGLSIPSWAIAYTTTPLLVPIPKTLTTASPNLCFTANAGLVTSVLQTSATISMIAEPLSSVVTTTGSTFFVASGSAVSLTVSGAQASGFATMTYAPTGLCNSPQAYFIPPFSLLSNSITPLLTIPSSLAGQSIWSVVPCLSYYSGNFVEQTASTVLSVASAQPSSITGMNPSTFVVPSSVVSAQFTGAAPTPQTRIALSLDTGCTSFFSSCQASYTIPGTLTFPAGCTSTNPVTLFVCYSTNSGGSYVYQPLVTVNYISDPEAQKVTSITPNIVGIGSFVSVTISRTEAFTGNAYMFGFTTGSCATCNTTCEGLTIISASTVTLKPFLTVQAVWQVCYTTSYGQSWSQQVNPGATMRTISAQVNSITSISPSVVGQSTSKLYTFTGVVGSVTSYIGFSLSASCATVTLSTNIPVGATTLSLTTNSMVGTYGLCYSTNFTNTWVRQTGITLAVAVATPTSISYIAPTYRLGVGYQIQLTLTMANDTMSIDSQVAVGNNSNCGALSNVVSIWPGPSAVLPITATLASGVRPLCFTTGGSGGWIQQTLVNLTMFAASGSSITAITPQIIGVNTLPAITFAGATLLSTAYVSFVINDYDCGFSEKSYGLTNLGVSTTQVLNQAIVLAATTPLYICYTTNFGVASPTWFRQTLAGQLTVVRALTTSLTSISPSTVSANVQLTLAMPLADVFPTGSFISFSPLFGSCATLYLTTPYTGASVTLSANFTTAGVYYVCYTVDSGANWVAQAPALTVILGSSTSISSVSPAYIGTNTTVTLTLGGVIATQHTRIGFSLSLACTSMLNNVAYPNAPTISPLPFVAPGNYYICYSTDAGATWSAQTVSAAILHVLDATPTSVSTMTPVFFASGIGQVISLNGDPVTPKSFVSFAANDTCSTGPYYGVANYGTSVSSNGVPLPGIYQLCYSVDNKQTWVGQPHVVEALYPSPYFLSGVRPRSFGANTIPSIEINRTESRVTPQARLAWVLEASGDCNNAGDRQAQMTLTSANAFALPAVILTGGVYVGCISFNNQDWVKQTLNASFLVIAGSPTSVSTITPRVFQNGEDARVTLTGVAFTTTSMLAFAKTGRCNDPTGRQAVTPWIPDEDDSVSLASIIDTGEAYSTLYLCYSVDNGQTYYEQSNCSVTVLTKCNELFDCGGCHQNPFCTWCLGESLCIKQEDLELNNCTSPVTPDDTSGCPVLSFPTRMSGSNAGFSNVSLGSNGKFLESDELRCHWDFVTYTNETVLNVLTPSNAWCYSPPAATGVPSGFLSVYYHGKIYASGTRPWTFYNCNQRISNLCTDCYTTSKPECGTCFENNACQPSFQCSGLWGGSQCPSISELEPSQLNFRGGWVNVTGNLFVNSTALTCQFVSAGVVQYANATWIDTNTVFCYAPQFDPNRVVQVTLNHHDLVYSRNGLPLLYIPDPVVAAVIQPPAPVEPNRVTVPLVTTIVVLVVVAAVLMVVFWNRRRKARLMLMPPDLTPALKEAIIYGEPKGPANTKNVAPYTNDLIELLMVPNSPIINVLAKVCESTESDNMSRAMVFVCESRRRTVEVMKQLVSMEVQAAESMSTLFRTNSFVTKMFKTYSKVAGLEYLHATLGYELNASLHAAKGDGEEEGPGLDVKDDSNEDVQLNKLILLTVCQRVFLAVTKNEKEVPHEFRELFLHVKTCMQNKFPAVSGYLAKLTASNLSASLVETTNSINDGERALSVQELSALQSKLLTSVTGGATDASMQGQITQLTANIEVLNTQLAATLKSCRDMEASFNPDSEAAKRVLVEHNQAQNAIACGGFFFLRFLVPAITAPDSYALMREAPDANKIKTLVLCGKVLQNLSNDKEMGGKEAHMAKMNEFIISNRRQMQKFQSNLMTKRPVVEAGVTVESAAVPVPARHLEAASAYMYDFIAMRLKNIMAQLDAPAAPGEDDKAVNMRAQMANMLMHVMGTINTKAGDYASVPKNADNSHAAITEARKSLQQTSMATMKTIRTDDSSASPEPISLESATTDSGAGMFAPPPAAAASTGSMASFNSKQTGGINFATLNNDLMTINPVFPTNDSVSSFGGPAPMLNTAESEMLRTISQPAGPPPPQPSIAPPPEFMSFRASDGDLFG